MSDRSDESLELPYGRWAAWGAAASAVLTLTAVLFAPLSPVCLARQAVDAARTGPGEAAAAMARAGETAGTAAASAGSGGPEAATLSRTIRAELRRELGIRVDHGDRRDLGRMLEEDLPAGGMSGILVRVLGLGGSPGTAHAPLPPLPVGL